MGRVIKDWSVVDFKNPEHFKKVVGAVNAFLHEPSNPTISKEKLEQFSVVDDLTEAQRKVVARFWQTEAFDMGYEKIYQIDDYIGQGLAGFTVEDVTAAIVFKKMQDFNKSETYQIAAGDAFVPFYTMSAGLAWTAQMIRQRQWVNIESNIAMLRNQGYHDRAQDFYDGLTIAMTAASGQDIAWGGTTDDTQAQRDAYTANNAVVKIIRGTKDLGLGITPMSQFTAVVPLELVDRVAKALSSNQQEFDSSRKLTNYNIELVPTAMLRDASGDPITDQWYIVAPGRKLRGGIEEEFELTAFFDPSNRNQANYAFMSYGLTFGQSKQGTTLAIA